jgi:hypothetical protein
VQSRYEDMAQEFASHRMVDIGGVVEDTSDRDLKESVAGVGGDAGVGKPLGGNFGMMGHHVRVRSLVRSAHLSEGMGVDALPDDRSCVEVGIGIGMVLDYGFRKHSGGVAGVADNMTMGRRMVVVDSP